MTTTAKKKSSKKNKGSAVPVASAAGCRILGFSASRNLAARNLGSGCSAAGISRESGRAAMPRAENPTPESENPRIRESGTGRTAPGLAGRPRAAGAGFWGSRDLGISRWNLGGGFAAAGISGRRNLTRIRPRGNAARREPDARTRESQNPRSRHRARRARPEPARAGARARPPRRPGVGFWGSRDLGISRRNRISLAAVTGVW